MARPGLVKQRHTFTLEELAEHPILTQGGRSGSGLFFNKWLKSEGVVFPKVLSSDSLTALVGLTVAGLGVSYLPRRCFQPLIDEGDFSSCQRGLLFPSFLMLPCTGTTGRRPSLRPLQSPVMSATSPGSFRADWLSSDHAWHKSVLAAGVTIIFGSSSWKS